MANFKVSIKGTSIPTLGISKVPKGTSFILEEGRTVSAMSHSESSDWETSICGLQEIQFLANTGDFKKSKNFGGNLGKHIMSIHSTAESRQIGESPTYLVYTSKVDDSKISFDMHDVGDILQLRAQKLAMLVRRGGFLAGEQGIIIDMFALTGDNTRFMANLLQMSFFQRISGSGLYWLEIQGNLADPIELFPGEIVRVDPLKLVAMSESVHIISDISTSSDQKVRKATEKDFDILLQADVRGGTVYLSSAVQKPHGTVKK